MAPIPADGVEPRRYLITVISAEYQEPAWNRPGLLAARDRMVELFTREFGYQHLDIVPENPTEAEILSLRRFCTAPERRPDDLIVVYLAGHGEVLDEHDGGGHVLLTSDTSPDDIAGALRTEHLATRLLAGTRVRRLLLMLDTCYSAQGGNELTAGALERMNPHLGAEPGSGLAVLSSAQPMEQAGSGVFPSRLRAAVANLATAGHAPRTLALDAVVQRMNTDPGSQRVGLVLFGLTGEVPAFLPNPHHQPQLTGVDLDIQRSLRRQRQAERREEELRTRLMLRATGGSSLDGGGGPVGRSDPYAWWFSGRQRALDGISAWLAAPAPARPALAVTAGPGSGKTAVLGLFATLAHPRWRETVPRTLHLGPALPAAARRIDVSLYAQNLTDQQVMAGIAAAAGCEAESAGALLDALDGRPGPLTVLVDAVEEAATPVRLCTTVLRPLIENAGGRIRLLLGTRPHLLPQLGLAAQDVVGLDDDEYADPQALLTYTVRNLLQGAPSSPYQHCSREKLTAVAGAIAEAAGNSFLVARITAGTHAALAEVPDPADPGWRDGLPRHAGQAMARDLADRLTPEDVTRATDLLRPLAYAEGQGLPWEDLWAPIASAVSGRAYSDKDVRWLHDAAGSYLVEAVEEDRSAYRLYHQALAEHLREHTDARAVHAAFARALLGRVPYGSRGERRWQQAHPYTLQYLATHAAEGGVLDEALAEPGFLVHAAPEALLPRLDAAAGAPARLAAAVYRASLGVHRDLPPEERRALLAVDALRYGGEGDELAAGLRDQLAPGAWAAQWATGSGLPTALRNTLTGRQGMVRALAFRRRGGRPVLVSTGDDRSIRSWDLTTGQEVGIAFAGLPPGQPPEDFALFDDMGALYPFDVEDDPDDPDHPDDEAPPTCAVLDADPPMAAVAEGTAVQFRDLAGDGYLGERPHGARITALVGAVREGRPVLVIGDDQGLLTVRDASDWTVLARCHAAPGGRVERITCFAASGRPLAVTVDEAGAHRAWDLTDATALGPGFDPDAGFVAQSTTACAVIDGRPVAVVADDLGTLRRWDLGSGEPYGPPFEGRARLFSVVTCGVLDGRPVLLAAGADGRVRVWDLASGRSLAELPTGDGESVTALAWTELDGRPVVVTGGVEGTIRVLDLSATAPVGSPVPGHPSAVLALACTPSGAAPLALSAGSDGTVLTWDLTEERPVGRELPGHRSAVSFVNCTELSGRPLAVTGSHDGTVLAWDLTARKRLGPPLTGHGDRLALGTCTVLARREVLHTVGSDGTVRLRDLHSGHVEVRPPTDPGLLSPNAAHTTLGRRQVVVTTGFRLTVRDLHGTTVARSNKTAGPVSALACLPLEDRTLALTATVKGILELWELGRSGIIGGFVHPTGEVRAAACTVLDGRPVAATAGDEGPVFFWDLDTVVALGTANHIPVLAVLHLPAPCHALAFTPNGDLLAAFHTDLALFRRL